MKEKIHHLIIVFGLLTITACGTVKTPASTTQPLVATLEVILPTATFTPLPTAIPQNTPVEPTPESAAIIATPVPTDLPVNPVYVKAFCTIIGQEKTTRVPMGSDVYIIWGWNAKTEVQINDFLENGITTVTLDGKVIEGSQTGGITKVEARNDLEVVWISPVGVLDPGQHTITYDLKFEQKIEDGYASYGPGTENETEHDECLIAVE